MPWCWWHSGGGVPMLASGKHKAGSADTNISSNASTAIIRELRIPCPYDATAEHDDSKIERM